MNTWRDDRNSLAEGYVHHAGTLRGTVRHTLVTRAMLHHLAPRPRRVLDVGGGAGHQAIALARFGHQVTVLDPDGTMLTRAEAALADQSSPVCERVHLVPGSGEHAAALVGGDFDAVCCHGVLMYLDNPDSMLRALVNAARPGGLISVLAKNGAGLAMRPALERRWDDAHRLLHAADRSELGRLGVPSRADTPAGVARTLAHLGADTLTWYGVRIFTDHLGDEQADADFQAIVDLEWAAGQREPYRSVARLFHLVARRRPPGHDVPSVLPGGGGA